MKKQAVSKWVVIIGLISMTAVLMSGCFAGAITDEPYVGEETSENSVMEEVSADSAAEAEVTKLWLVDRDSTLPLSLIHI